jgi:DNA invertase Pin-like site-specific DNA recombinase
MELHKKKVCIYARCSTGKQELDNQLLQLRAFAEKQDWEIVQEYTETVSGTKDNRPEFTRLFKDAHKRLFDLVLFWDLSRFSRSGTLYTLQKLRELENLKVGWHSYQEAYISTTGAFKDVVLSIFATMAKMERDKISERTKAGMERAKKEGRRIGRPPKNSAVLPKISV